MILCLDCGFIHDEEEGCCRHDTLDQSGTCNDCGKEVDDGSEAANRAHEYPEGER